MHRKLAVPGLFRQILDLGGKCDAGVVEQNVEAAKGGQGVIDGPLPIGFRGHIKVPVKHVSPLIAQCRGGALTQFIANVGQHNFSALAYE